MPDVVPEMFVAWLAAEMAKVGELPAGEARRGRLVDLAADAARAEAAAAAVKAAAVAALHGDFLAAEQDDLAQTLADLRNLADQSGPSGSPAPDSADSRRELARRRSDRRRWETEARRRADRATTASVSLALGISLWAADRLLDLSVALAEHPPVQRALATGRLDQGQAVTVLAGVALLPNRGHQDRLITRLLSDPNNTEGRARLVRELRHDGRRIWDVPAHKLRPIIAREAAHLDPTALADVETRAVDERRVAYCTGAGQDLATLILTGPEAALSAAYGYLDQAARQIRKAGHPDNLDHLRFDLAIGALTHGAHGLTTTHPNPGASGEVEPGPHPASGGDVGLGSAARGRRVVLPRPRSRTLVNITVAKSTLDGHDDTPATLHTPAGDVPTSAALARDLAQAHDAQWRTITCDPATGTAVDISATHGPKTHPAETHQAESHVRETHRPDRYRPDAATAELVRVRDGHCSRFPTSGARTLELDHVIEFNHTNPNAGGATATSNLASNGKRDHQDKTDRLIHVTGDANDVLTYETGTGHTYRSWPHQYLDPAPPPGEPPDGAPDEPPDEPPGEAPDEPPGEAPDEPPDEELPELPPDRAPHEGDPPF